MTSPICHNDGLSKLEDLVRTMVNAPCSEESHIEGRRRIMAAVYAQGAPRKVLSVRKKIILGVCAAAAGAALVVWPLTRSRPITYDIVGGSSFASGYLSASPDRAALVRFSDGSSINASPGARLRVDSTLTDGARVLLERGTAAVQVHHAKGSRWAFIAGPFEVQVVGTRFTLAWDPTKEEVDLLLEEGAVKVRSPLGQGPFEVRKGQEFHASLINRTIRIKDENGTTSRAITAASDLPIRSLDPPLEGEPANDRSGNSANAATESPNANDSVIGSGRLPPGQAKFTSGPRQESWQSLVSHGRFLAVVDAAEARGIDSCLQSCSISDIRALADAARYTGRSGVAEKSLLAIRERAPAGNQRSAAAFLLGRTSESRGQGDAANTWYDKYLAEARTGEFAADALAGKMRVILQTRGYAAAKPVAVQYLERYPNGVHADTARKIIATQ